MRSKQIKQRNLFLFPRSLQLKDFLEIGFRAVGYVDEVGLY